MEEATIIEPEPKVEETLSEELKLRLKPSQRRALSRVAAQLGHSEASMARHAIVQRLEEEGALPSSTPRKV